MILVDAHVHIYNCFDLEKFLDSAYSNFKTAAEKLGHGSQFTGILLLAETSKENWFQHLSEYADGKDLPDGKTAGNWKFHHTDEGCSLHARSDENRELFIMAGRQFVTLEGLEVLSLASTNSFLEGLPIRKLIANVRETGGIPVIPWGFGKWIGKRGTILKELLGSMKDPAIYLGDNGGRPKFLGQPSFFKMADDLNIRILPGSDPFPFVSEYIRAGSFGLSLSCNISFDYPADQLKKELFNLNNGLHTYGKFERPFRFLRNQIQMQINNRF